VGGGLPKTAVPFASIEDGVSGRPESGRERCPGGNERFDQLVEPALTIEPDSEAEGGRGVRGAASTGNFLAGKIKDQEGGGQNQFEFSRLITGSGGCSLGHHADKHVLLVRRNTTSAEEAR